MRRRWTAAFAVAMVAGSLWAASPAQAAEADRCLLALSEPVIVVIGPGTIDVYPGNVAPYATGLVSSVRSYVNCVIAETAGPVVACANAYVANRPTVSVDPTTLHISIDYSAFLGTSCAI